MDPQSERISKGTFTVFFLILQMLNMRFFKPHGATTKKTWLLNAETGLQPIKSISFVSQWVVRQA